VSIICRLLPIVLLIGITTSIGCPLKSVPGPGDIPDIADTTPDIPIVPDVSEVTDTVSGLYWSMAGTESLFREILLEGPVVWVRVLANGVVLAATEDEVWQIEESLATKISSPEELDPATIGWAVGLSDGTLLLGTPADIYVSTEEGLVSSPLAEVLGSDTISDALSRPNGGDDIIWFSTSDGIQFWQDGSVYLLTVDDMDTANALITWGAVTESGSPSLWAATDGQVFALEKDGDDYVVLIERTDLPTTAIAANAQGELWLSSGGSVEARMPDGGWYGVTLPVEAGLVVAHPHADGVWLEATDGAIYHIHDMEIWNTDGAPEGALADSDAGGRVLVVADDGLLRLNPGRSIGVSGIANGQSISNTTTVHITPSFPELVSTVSVSLDNSPAQLLDPPWDLTLNTTILAEGSHELGIEVQYTDDIVIVLVIVFDVSPDLVTWTDDIQNIADNTCGNCHGAASALERKLFTIDHWIEDIDDIINAVETGLMPPGEPLDEELIQLIKTWADLGFLE